MEQINENAKAPQPPEGQAPQLPEEPAAQPGEEAGQPDALSQLQEKYDQLNDQYLRCLAEYDNYRKRTQREREQIYPEATAAAVLRFLPVVDNFERARQAPCSDEQYAQGIEMIYTAFSQALAGLGVEPVGEAGEAFDPAVHNAVMHVEDAGQPEGVVLEVLQKGYRLGDKILRYAMVKVAN